METFDLLSIITIAFLGSFGHCVGMCGGIVIAYSSSKIDIGWSRFTQALAHLLSSRSAASINPWACATCTGSATCCAATGAAR